MFYSCSYRTPTASIEFQNRYTAILNQYTKTHFIGVGNATSSTEQLAIKIAKTKALGELADNIKVTILSRLELVSTEITTGDQTQLSESVKENIGFIFKKMDVGMLQEMKDWDMRPMLESEKYQKIHEEFCRALAEIS